MSARPLVGHVSHSGRVRRAWDSNSRLLGFPGRTRQRAFQQRSSSGIPPVVGAGARPGRPSDRRGSSEPGERPPCRALRGGRTPCAGLAHQSRRRPDRAASESTNGRRTSGVGATFHRAQPLEGDARRVRIRWVRRGRCARRSSPASAARYAYGGVKYCRTKDLPLEAQVVAERSLGQLTRPFVPLVRDAVYPWSLHAFLRNEFDDTVAPCWSWP